MSYASLLVVFGWFAASGVFFVSLLWFWLGFGPLCFLWLFTSLTSSDPERRLAVVQPSKGLAGFLRFCFRVVSQIADVMVGACA